MADENPKRYAKEYVKWQRRDKSIQKLQQNMSLKRMKPTCITMVPLMIFFFVLRQLYIQTVNVYGSVQTWNIPVAKPPMNPYIIPLIGAQMYASFASSVRVIWSQEGFINFTSFYMLGSFGMNIFIGKIFGVSMTTEATGGGMGSMGGMGSLFDSQTALPKPGGPS